MRSKKICFYLILWLAGLLPVCGYTQSSLDESDLQQVADDYYRPTKAEKLDHSNLYHYLSKKSKDQIAFETWDKSPDANATNGASGITLLGSQDNSGQTYQVVSVLTEIRDKEGKIHRMVYSDTWMMENGKWRRLVFTQAEAAYEQAFTAGDFDEAQTKAQDWLALDPYSIEANLCLGYAMVCAAAKHNQSGLAALQQNEALAATPQTGDDASQEAFYKTISTNEKLLSANIENSTGAKLDDIAANMIEINPCDSSTLYCVADMSQSDDLKKNYFLKRKETATDPDDIFALASNIQDMHLRFDFLSGFNETPDILLLELDGYAVLAINNNSDDSLDTLRDFKNNKGSFENIRPALDNMASHDAAEWAGRVGELLFNNKDYDYAQQFLDYGNKRETDDAQIKQLAHDLSIPRN